MEYDESYFQRLEHLVDWDALETFENNGVTVKWFESNDVFTEFKDDSDDTLIQVECVAEGYVRIDITNKKITRIEDEFINLPDNEWGMDWY